MNAYAPISHDKSSKVTDAVEKSVLLEQLRKIRRRALDGEAERRATARRGAKLAKGKMWEEGITSGRLPITANQAIAMGEEFIAQILRGDPVPEINPINGADEDGAALIEGALITGWRRKRMLSMFKSGARLAFFSFPVLGYTWWDEGANDGVGDTATRIVPAHNTIIDNRHWFVKDMEFVGIRETMSRARAIMLFPDMANEIESAANADTTEKPGLPEDPWDSPFHQGRPNSLSRLVADNQGNFTGKTTIKVGGRRRPTNPLAEEIGVEFMWIKDPTPITIEKPRLNGRGKPMHKHVRDPESLELQFDHAGWEPVQTEHGPMYRPKLRPRLEPLMEKAIVKKYPRWRHVAWIPSDDIVLWDVNWDAPAPLFTLRTSYPLNEYWQEGQGLRLASLTIARNILYTIIFQRLKLSLGGTWVASHRSGLKRYKLTPEDGQVFYGKNIGPEDLRQFPVTPIDVSYINVLHEIESEMMKLIGLSPLMRGVPAGRADSGKTYDALIEQSSTAITDAMQLLEESISDYAEIEMWHYQNFYTHEHFVEVEAADGLTSWRQASRVAMRGKYALRMDVTPMAAHSPSAQRDLAKEGGMMGIYPLPFIAKMGRYPQWRRALKLKMQLAGDPSKAPLMGPAGAPPGKVGGQGGSTNRSHHAPNEKQSAQRK